MRGWARYEDEYELREDIVELFDEASRVYWDHLPRVVRANDDPSFRIARTCLRFRSRGGAGAVSAELSEAKVRLARQAAKAARVGKRILARLPKPPKRGRPKPPGHRCRRCGAASPTHRCPGAKAA